jgi:hypothetical protein
MTNAERRLQNMLNGDSDSMELLPNGSTSLSKGVGAAISQIVGNPAFKAEVNLTFNIRYYSQAVVGTPVAVAAAAIPAAQQTQLPLYVFGQSDLMGNYTRARSLVAGGAGWTYADMKIIKGGSGDVDIKPLPHAAAAVDYASGTIFNNLLQNGDLLIMVPMAGFVAGAAATTVIAEITVHCGNVPYLTLVDSLGSDLITLNMIRYTVPAALVAQLGNQITLIMQTLFGKTNTDTLDPNTFIHGGTFNPNIADIPITLPIDKNLVLATPVNFDCIQFTWTCTVAKITKLTNIPGAR